MGYHWPDGTLKKKDSVEGAYQRPTYGHKAFFLDGIANHQEHFFFKQQIPL